MKKSKRLISFMAALLAVSMMSVGVLAHGGNHHGGRRNSSGTSAPYPYCPVADCTQAGAHTHDGITYCAHRLNDGHDYHSACPVQECTKTGAHEHDGTTYYGHTYHNGIHH